MNGFIDPATARARVAVEREDLRAVQRAVRDGVTVAEARRRMARDAGTWRSVAIRPDSARPRSVRALVGLIGLSVVLWGVAIVAAVTAGKLVALLVWLAFAGAGVLAIVSIARDVRTAIRWWRR